MQRLGITLITDNYWENVIFYITLFYRDQISTVQHRNC